MTGSARHDLTLLTQALREGTRDQRVSAAITLGNLGERRAVVPLIDALHDPDNMVWHFATEALGQIGDVRAYVPLVEAFTDPDYHNVARTAADSVGRLKGVPLDPLVTALQHKHRNVRYCAASALYDLNDKRAVDALLSALDDEDWQVRQVAAAALGNLGDKRAIEPLTKALDDAEVSVRSVALAALRKLGDPAALATLDPREGTYTFEVYADHSQFYVGDSAFDGDTAADTFWNDEAFARRLAIAPPSLIGVSTDLYGTVPVMIEVRQTAPGDDTAGWDHVVEASLELPSGRLAIDGCLDYRPEASRYAMAEHETSPHISVSPGSYRVRVYYGNLDSIHEVTTPDGVAEVSDEHYRLVLWPALYGEHNLLSPLHRIDQFVQNPETGGGVPMLALCREPATGLQQIAEPAEPRSGFVWNVHEVLRVDGERRIVGAGQ